MGKSWLLDSSLILQIEKLSFVNFLICVEILFRESVQIIVLRITVIAGKQN